MSNHRQIMELAKIMRGASNAQLNDIGKPVDVKTLPSWPLEGAVMMAKGRVEDASQIINSLPNYFLCTEGYTITEIRCSGELYKVAEAALQSGKYQCTTKIELEQEIFFVDPRTVVKIWDEFNVPYDPIIREYLPRTIPSLTRQGDRWIFEFEGITRNVNHGTRMLIVKALLANEGTRLDAEHVEQLAGKPPRVHEQPIEVTDTRSINEYRDRLREVAKEREEAEEAGDDARLFELDEECKNIEQALGQGTNVRGRPRTRGSAQSKAANNVRNHVNGMVSDLKDIHASLSEHLKVSIDTGSVCSYRPDEPQNWIIEDDSH